MIRALLILLAIAAAAPAAPNRGLAILSSAALPGSGQMILGTQQRGEALMWLDGAIWAVWGGLTWMGASREQDARLLSAAEAGSDLSIKDLKYYKALERYDNAEEYNEDIRREARDRYPDDPVRQHSYYEANMFDGEAAWNWSSDSARFDFWRTRKASRSATLTAGFAAGALLLNRLASIVDCAFFAGPDEQDARLDFGPAEFNQASIGVRYRF